MEIKDYAFADQPVLEEISIPVVTNITAKAFLRAPRLRWLELPNETWTKIKDYPPFGKGPGGEGEGPEAVPYPTIATP